MHASTVDALDAGLIHTPRFAQDKTLRELRGAPHA
jgi:hypothetical protein